ncbi:hypothetical protein [Clostridium sp. ZBS18]|uniref:hypothetical protein n=1 Tax=Clostridium sp. ZBS18 TaxID=2949967 RepID=UPI002079F03A|nr:hypothetical protein [Clostridium sp. ZBS18]
MEDMYGIEINENDFIHIDRKKNPKVGRVIEDDDNKLKCVGLYLNEDGNVIIGDKFIAVLKKI